MQVSNTFTVNVYFVPQKQILGDLKNEKSQNNALIHGKLQRCQTQRSDTQITAEIKQTYYGSIFSLQHNTKSPSQTRVKRQKGRETEKKAAESGKCTNATNRRSRVGLSNSFCIKIIKPVRKIKRFKA